MKISDEIFKSYLRCQYKAHLKLCKKKGKKTDFEKFNDEIRKAHEIEVTQQFINEYSPVDILQSPLLEISDLKKDKKVIITPHLEIDNISTSFFALEKFPENPNLESFTYLPIVLSENKKITKEFRLFLTFKAVCLKELLGNTPHIGKIICRGSKRRRIIKLKPYYREVKKVIQAIQNLNINKIAPKLMLNKYCELCEFQSLCHKKAITEDDLSLLSGMRPKEILRQNNRGIFTIKQYSYTFRARKKRKRVKEKKTPHISSLKALSIREKKIYINEKPQLPDANVRIYLDIEGDPDQDLQYLIGALIVKNNSAKLYSFWADTQEDEKIIFNQLFSVIAQHENYYIFHYGNYEKKCIKKIGKRFNEFNISSVIDHLVDVFSIIHSNIYMPTYSNKLKDIAKHLGFQWTENNASGLQSILWRRKWEVTKDTSFKQRLLTYNHEDCQALKKVTEFVYQIIHNLKKDNLDGFGIEYAQNMKLAKDYNFQKQTFVFPDLEHIN